MSRLILLLTCSCAVTDVLHGKIYNLVVVPAAIATLLLRGLPWMGGSRASLMAGIVQMIGMLLFLLPFWLLTKGGIGGGDIKLYVAVAGMLRGRQTLLLLLVSLLLAEGWGMLRRLCGCGGRRIRIGPAVFCAAVLAVGGVYG